ncbi:MAG TPA: sigma-70 family RNA polymerase sigma factor, partial [Candidatus Limnocylindrales bacterium]
ACADQQRRARRTRLDVAIEPLDHPEPTDDFARVADRDALDRAFDRLSFDQRAVLVLTHYVGMPGPEVAEILGIPVGTVASRLHYAIRAMRAELSPTPDLPMSSAERVR